MWRPIMNVRTRVLIFCMCLTSTVWGRQAAAQSSADWTEFHRTNMQRWNPNESLLNPHNVQNLKLKWSYTTGSQVYCPPTVANGVVFIGSDDFKLYALKAATGELLWSFATGDSVHTAPAVADGVVFVGSEEGDLYALKAATGAKLWSYNIGSDFSSPAVANGVVYVGGVDGFVYALKASTGELLWVYMNNSSVPS